MERVHHGSRRHGLPQVAGPRRPADRRRRSAGHDACGPNPEGMEPMNCIDRLPPWLGVTGVGRALVWMWTVGGVAAVLCAAAEATAAGAGAGGNSEVVTLKQEIESLVAGAYPETTAPGCAVIARVDGKTIVAGGFGVANLETGEPNSPETNFRIASMTKQFTAAAILRLVDEGKLSLNDTLADVFPQFPPYARGITVRHLLIHTSGLPDYEDLMATGTTEQILDAGVLDLLASQTSPTAPAGKAYNYSNSGYAVLARIVEEKSGKSFAALLRDAFFVPFGMEGTVAYEKGKSEVVRRAYGYRRNKEGTFELADQSPTSAVLGDGGIYTSVNDYAKWADAWFEGKVLKPDRQAAAWTRGTLDDDSVTTHGCGWEIVETTGPKRVQHTGGTTGFNTMGVLVPTERICVAIFSNRNGNEPKTLVPQIVELILAVRNGDGK